MFSRKFIAATREISTYETPVSAPLMRRTFKVSGKPERVALTITGLGFYDLWLNGKRITRGHLAPYISNPDHYIYFDEYDLTQLVLEGENVLGIVLGNGMMDCAGGAIWDFDKARWRGSPRTAFALEITDANDERVLEADENVLTHESPIYRNDLRGGEFYDARKEIAGWSAPGFDDSGWKNAIRVEAPRGECVIGRHRPIVIERSIAPVSVTWGEEKYPSQPRNDVTPQHISVPDDELGHTGYIYDFGENNAGVCTLRIKGRRGQKIIMQFDELMSPDGGLDNRNMRFMPPEFNQRDIYILRGDEEGETYTPVFTFHGFRYCLVMGMTEEQATPEALTMHIMHGDFENLSDFDCSDELVNRLYRATLRSNVSNFGYFPTDCPHREKNGWTGDASLSAEQFMLHHRMDASIEEWLRDVRATQTEIGALPGIIPTDKWGYAWGNGPAWDNVVVNLPYYLWRYRGNTRVIKENAVTMMRYLDYVCTRRDERGLIHFGLGDWCQVNATDYNNCDAPLELTDTVLIVDFCDKAAAMFEAVGYTERAAYARSLRAALYRSAREHLIDTDTTLAKGTCQTSQAMAIFYNIFTEEEKTKAVENLVQMIHANHDKHRNGILGARVMYEVLARYGYADLAAKVAFSPSFPSFGYWMANGATALPESFKPFEEPQDSHNHHFFGSITSFMMKCLAGIEVNEDCTDPKKVCVAPHFVESLRYVRAKHTTVCGDVKTSWEREKDGVLLTVTIPDGVYGTVKALDGYAFVDGCKEKPIVVGTTEYHML